MAEVRYSGPQPSRDIATGEGRRVRIEKGKTANVPDRVAKELVKQRYFSRANKKISTPSQGSEPTALRQPAAESKKEES